MPPSSPTRPKPLGTVPPGRREAALASVEEELHGERARALGQTVRALEDALAALAAADRAPAPATGPRRPRGGHRVRDDLVAEAAERLWFAVVQREAMGLLRHDGFLQDLGVPTEVQRRIGPRRRRA
ncbi:MAG TPA: hypothetical protein VFM53_07005 [Anaeromyxobacteraceae bacterium]|nr:hypothetical protein [Anaeromyxobacteraceae bacterium]